MGKVAKGKNKLIPKTNDFIINFEDLRDKLTNLRKNSSKNIRHLHGGLADDFEVITTYVRLLYDSREYIKFHNEVKSVFGDLNDIIPGTIGAYCAGCLHTTSLGNECSCSVICAGSIPPPKDRGDWSFCDKKVIWAVIHGDSYDFVLLNNSQDRKAYLFVDDAFVGFTDEEKRKIHQFDCDIITLMNYSEDGKEYNQITEVPTSVDLLPSRSTSLFHSYDKKKISQRSFATAGGIFFILIIFACIYFFLFI